MSVPSSHFLKVGVVGGEVQLATLEGRRIQNAEGSVASGEVLELDQPHRPVVPHLGRLKMLKVGEQVLLQVSGRELRDL
jgi:hypothetical protein